MQQFLDFIAPKRWLGRKARIPGHITVTGGEPFVRNDFFDLLEIFYQNRHFFSFAILTNGTLIDAQLAHRLSALRPSFVQVSIEGSEPTHDSIRGTGNFVQTVAAVQYLVQHKVPTIISFTAHQANYREFPDVARLGQQLSVARVWADRLIPVGSGTQQSVLTPQQTLEFFQLMHQARTEATLIPHNQTEIAMHRALQFLVGGGTPYHCTAGDTLLTVQPNGDLLPCRRMPIPVGNLMEHSLSQLYDQSDWLRTLRDRHSVSEQCAGCRFVRQCRGGLRCLSYACTGDPFQTDPGCWHMPQQRIGD